MVDGAGRALSDNVARAIGAFFRLPDEGIEAAIRETPVVRRRLKVHNLGQFTVIDDSISANPLSMKLGLATLGEISQTRRKIAVLGYMPELGSGSQTYHEEIAEFARGRADLIVGVGTLAKHYAPQVWFETVEACISGLPTVLRPGDIVFVKGAMLLHMDRVVAALRRTSQEWGATGG